ncbi:hypothetical protein HX049_17875 [Myroides odoratimimus]|uniref:hypothetical protein n=1 Tax=Myroides odoratimimus TaxID=76832 RepID=UPI002577B2A6|nr:hypothetical protein [Myroides odoratimimus]MDM1399005.1 hypothetical protein [Myroides odoratimimus]
MTIWFVRTVFLIGAIVSIVGLFKTVLLMIEKQGTTIGNILAILFYWVFGLIALICLNYAIDIFTSFDIIVLLFFCVIYLTVCAFIAMVLKE